MDINPIVKVNNQKKPKGLLRAVWEQLCVEDRAGEWANAFSACAYDGRKNVFTPIMFPIPPGESTEQRRDMRERASMLPRFH